MNMTEQQELEKLREFKRYVHDRLDKANVPTHPDGVHSKEGCRIGDRLDIVLGVYVASQTTKVLFSTTIPVTGQTPPALSHNVHFDGETYEPAKDHHRLGTQLDRIYHVMKHGHWVTLPRLVDIVGGTTQSLSARIRDFRKEKFIAIYGKWDVQRERIGRGHFRYRLVGQDAPGE